MQNTLAKLSVPLICSALIFGGCGTAGTKSYSGGQGNTNAGANTSSAGSTTTANKTNYGAGTTDTSGKTGTGTTGTAGTTGAGKSFILGAGGISTSLENQLKQAGVNQTRVLVLDDTVILGQASTSGNGSGAAGTGGAKGSGIGSAQSQIQSMLGGVQVLTVTDPEGLRAMDRVKNSLKTTNISSTAVSSDIATVIRSARPSSSGSTQSGAATSGQGSSTYSGSGSSLQSGSNAR